MGRWASPRVVAGLGVLLAVGACAVLAPVLAPHDPDAQDILSALLPAGADPAYPLGTDSLGRCVLSRLLFGTRTALSVAVLAASGAMLLGSALAYVAGYARGPVDWLVSRAVEVWMSFPPVVLALILMTGLGTGERNVVLAIVAVDWTRFCRVLRSQVLVVARRDHVAAARLLGFSHWRTLTREVVPATLGLLATLLSLEMGIAVVVESVLSFVGLGVRADQVAWGQMIADGRQAVFQAPLNLLAPTAAIFVTVAGFNLLGDGLRRAADLQDAGA